MCVNPIVGLEFKLHDEQYFHVVSIVFNSSFQNNIWYNFSCSELGSLMAGGSVPMITKHEEKRKQCSPY